MDIVRKFSALAICFISTWLISATYNNNTTKQLVKEDVNSEKIISGNTMEQGSESNTAESIEEKEIVKDDKVLDTNADLQNKVTLEAISGSYTNLSNEKCAWGFVRKPNGTRPEFYGPHAKVLDNYQGIYCGNGEDKVLYLTFDEGYENGYTASILDTLKEKGIQAAFFVTMPYAKQNTELVKRMISEGHIVGNHTVNHPSMPEVTDNEKLINEVMELHNYIRENYNYEMHYLRPPKGEYSERTVKMCLDLGYKNVLWSSAYADWDPNNQKGIENAKNMICNNFHNGNVLLLHAVSKDNANVLRRYNR